MTTTLAPPNAELVAQAWLATWSGIPARIIATSLPRDPDKATPVEREKLWTAFLTVRNLAAGTPNPDLAERRMSVVQLDAWARKPTSARQPWGVATTLLEKVRLATFRDVWTYRRPIQMPVSGYTNARVLGAYLTREPTRVEGDPSAYARYTCDLAVDWTV